MTADAATQIAKHGYLHIPNILTKAQVEQVRNYLQIEFQKPDVAYNKSKFLTDVFCRHPDLTWLYFHEPTLKILRSILGDDLVAIREHGAHMDFFSNWHKDTSSQERAGHNFHQQDDYLMVQVAYYLQDQHPVYGGCIDVVPGSHRKRDVLGTDRGIWSALPKFLRTLDGIDAWGNPVGMKCFGKKSLPVRAGDLVIFDFRLTHRATPQKRSSSSRGCKLALFSSFSRNNSAVTDYIEFLTQRPDNTAYLTQPYPPFFLSLAARYGVNLSEAPSRDVMDTLRMTAAAGTRY